MPAVPPIPPVPIGWPLLPVPDSQGAITYPTLEQSVRESIQVILCTRPGEQLMRPLFGGGLENYLQQQNTTATRRQIRDAITESLTQWEPRILLDRVDVLESEQNSTSLRIEIAYRLLRTNAPQSVSLNMQLET